MLGQQDAAERRLTATLATNQQWYQRVTRQLPLAHPHGHHRSHPQMEQLRPLFVTSRNTLCQSLYPILTVPFWQSIQILIHRVIKLDIIRIHIATDILIPTLNALAQRSHSDWIARLLGQITECKSYTGTLSELSHTTHHILTNLVVLVQEKVDFHR